MNAREKAVWDEIINGAYVANGLIEKLLAEMRLSPTPKKMEKLRTLYYNESKKWQKLAGVKKRASNNSTSRSKRGS